MLWISYYFAQLKQLIFTGSSGERIVYTRAEHPYVFNMVTATFVLAGLFLLLLAFSSCFQSKEDASAESGAGSSPVMKRVWQVVNSVLILSSIYAGWSSMQVETLRHTNPDAILCGIIFIIMLLLPLGAVSYSIFADKQQTLRRPSLSRFSLDWWHDPLQCLFLSSCSAASVVIGAVFHLNCTTATGFWMFTSFVSILAGLLIGQIFVYVAFRSRVVDT